MAKDPAFLFYSSDFLTGTMFFTNEQVGIYIRLLCAQHSKGHLTPAEMNYFSKGDKMIEEKFLIDSDGNFYNERLEDEFLKRKKHSEHQRENINKRWNKKTDTKQIPKQYDGITNVIPLENENENVIINKDIIKDKGGMGEKENHPTLEEFLEYCSTLPQINFLALKFSIEAKYDTWVENEWKDGYGKKIKNWKTKIKNTIPHLKPIFNTGKEERIGRNTKEEVVQFFENINKIPQ